MSLGFVAFIMSSVSVAGCAFIVPSGDVDCYYRLGLFKYSNECFNSSVCRTHTKETKIFFSGATKASQAMGAIAAVFGGIVWVACIFMLFFKFPRWLFKTIGGVYCFCFVAQMLTLLALIDCNGEQVDALKAADSNFQCNLGKDAITGIVAAIFYLGIGITMLVCPVPKTAVITCCGDCCKEGCDEGGCDCCGDKSTEAVKVTNGNRSIQGMSISVNDGEEITNSVVTETFNADGSVTIKEERINIDGSKTVTTTTRGCSSL